MPSRTTSIQEVVERSITAAFISMDMLDPGTIVSYDPATATATVQPDLQILMQDESTQPKAPIHGVPVLWPGIGNYTFRGDLAAGTQVWLLWSQSGLEHWKAAGMGAARPGDGPFFQYADAICLPCLPRRAPLPAGAKIVIGDDTNTNFISMSDTEIVLTVGAFSVTLDENGITRSDGGAAFG